MDVNNDVITLFVRSLLQHSEGKSENGKKRKERGCLDIPEIRLMYIVKQRDIAAIAG